MSQKFSLKFFLFLIIVGSIVSIIFFINLERILIISNRIEWQKCLGGRYNDQAYSVQPTEDGEYIIAGVSMLDDDKTIGHHGYRDFWIVKLDKNGSIQWQKYLGGSNDDRAYSIQQTNDNGYIIVGGTESYDGDVSGNFVGWDFRSTTDFWVVKLNKEGNIEWQKCLGGSSWDEAHSIQQISDGGYIVAGWTYSNDGDVKGNHGYSDFWVVKLDNKGKIEWQKCLGGSDEDHAYSILQTKDEGYIVAGWTQSNDGDISGWHEGYDNDGNPLPDFWVVKLDRKGNIQWQRCLGGCSSDKAYSIQQTKEGGYIMVGITYSNDGNVSGYHGDGDIWIVKLDEKGNIEWQKCLGGSSWDEAHSIQQISDGGYIVAGWTYSNDGDVKGNHGYSDFWVVKLDNKGKIEWQKCLGGSDEDHAYSILQTKDGGYIVVGTTFSNDGDVSGWQGGSDFWVVKLK